MTRRVEMKKLILAAFLALAFTNTSFAGYGEDQSTMGECKKTDGTSTEVKVVETVVPAEEKGKKGKTK